MDMIERVAMALASDMEEGFPRFTQQRWDQMTALARAAHRQRARVAIEAMREPTLAMRKVSTFEAAERDWPAMIDAALSRPSPEKD